MEEIQLYSELKDELDYISENYIGKDVDELSSLFMITNKCKQKNSLIVKQIFLHANPLFFACNKYVVKTIQVDKYDKMSQAISFPAFDFETLIKENWETSTLRSFLSSHIFIFVIFKHDGNIVFLEKVIPWTIPNDILDNSIRKVWEKTKNVLETGNIVKYVENDKYFTAFPSAKENPYMHVRPHSQSKSDVKTLPVPDKVTNLTKYEKHCFWFNKQYINKIINEK